MRVYAISPGLAKFKGVTLERLSVSTSEYFAKGSSAGGRGGMGAKIIRPGAIDFDVTRLVGIAALVIAPVALHKLSALLTGDVVEIRPLTVEGNRYSVINVTKTIDCLDVGRSGIDSVSGRILEYTFSGDQITGPLFKIPQSPDGPILTPEWTGDPTSEFRAAVEHHSLNGIRFELVWDSIDLQAVSREKGKRLQDMAARHRKLAVGTSPTNGVPSDTNAGPKRLAAFSLDDAEKLSLVKALSDARQQDGLDLRRATELESQVLLEDAVRKFRARGSSADTEFRAFRLGVIWGQTLVEHGGWNWVMLQAEEGGKSIGVASPDRSYAILPIQCIEELLSNPGKDLNLQLLYNLVTAGRLPPANPSDLKLLG